MTRSIDIAYRTVPDSEEIGVSIPNPYNLFGCQEPSLKFWRLELWRLELWNEIGVERLAILGKCDPIWFSGWGEMALLQREIRLIHENVSNVEFEREETAKWLANLTYCHAMLVMSAPKDSVPILTIG